MEEPTEDSAKVKNTALAVTLVVMLLIPVVYVIFIKKDAPTQPIVIQQRVEAAPLPAQQQEQANTMDAASSEAAYINLALAYYTAKQYKECIDASRKALQLNPANASAYNNICSAYNSISMWDSAIVAGNKALALQPDYQLARNNLNWAIKMKGEVK